LSFIRSLYLYTMISGFISTFFAKVVFAFCYGHAHGKKQRPPLFWCLSVEHSLTNSSSHAQCQQQIKVIHVVEYTDRGHARFPGGDLDPPSNTLLLGPMAKWHLYWSSRFCRVPFRYGHTHVSSNTPHLHCEPEKCGSTFAIIILEKHT